jgi:hypothetical protein
MQFLKSERYRNLVSKASGSSFKFQMAGLLVAGGVTILGFQNCTGGFGTNIQSSGSSGTSQHAISVNANPATANIQIDMWQVMTAFAVHHPHDIKQLVGDPGDGDHAERLSGNILIDRYGSPRGRYIDDNLVLSGDGIGYAGSVQVIPWGIGYWWNAPYKLTSRYITVANVGDRYSTPVVTSHQNLDSPNPVVLPGTAPVTEGIDSFGYKNFGGTIGWRWYVRFAQIPIPASGLYTGPGINEISTFDLGPQEGVYDPQFGHLEYEQQGAGVAGGDNDSIWSNVVSGDVASSFYNSYSYGAPATSATYGSFQLHSGESKTVGDLTLLMQPEGNLVLYQGSTVLWAAGGNNGSGFGCSGNCMAYFQGAGNLVLYQNGVAYWSNTGNSVPANQNQLKISSSYPYVSIVNTSGAVEWQGLPFLNSDEFELYCLNPANRPNEPWCSNYESSVTATAPVVTAPPTPPPAPTPAASQGSYSSFKLYPTSGSNAPNSQNALVAGRLTLLMQYQGNLVLYQDFGTATAQVLWASGAGLSADCTSNGCFAWFQPEGNLVLYNNAGAYWYNTGSSSAQLNTNTLYVSLSAPYVWIQDSSGNIIPATNAMP